MCVELVPVRAPGAGEVCLVDSPSEIFGPERFHMDIDLQSIGWKTGGFPAGSRQWQSEAVEPHVQGSHLDYWELPSSTRRSGRLFNPRRSCAAPTGPQARSCMYVSGEANATPAWRQKGHPMLLSENFILVVIFTRMIYRASGLPVAGVTSIFKCALVSSAIIARLVIEPLREQFADLSLDVGAGAA